jgi:eukaryotic-like serine/threonine-protein kinase
MAWPTGVPAEGPLRGPRIDERYRIVAELGSGALGTVWLAEDTVAGGRVAMRVVPHAAAGRARVAEIVERMSRSIGPASMAHPALVRVLDCGLADNGRAVIVTEFAEGRRLSDVLATGAPLDVSMALTLALEVGGAVETAHNLGLIHGALRSRNVIVLEDGRAKVMDLELADLRHAPAMRLAETLPAAESLSPEQLRQESVTEKTDVYTFAIVVYEMLCGVPPFRAPTPEAVLAKQSAERPLWTRERCAVIPRVIRRTIEDALREQPERRPFMPQLLDGLMLEPPTQRTASRATIAIVGGAALATLIGLLATWNAMTVRPSSVAHPVYGTVPPDSGPVSLKPPEALSAPTGTRPPPVPERGPAASATRGTHSVPPSPSRAIRIEHREALAPQRSATAVATPSAAPDPDTAYDPNAVIEWLIESSQRGQ